MTIRDDVIGCDCKSCLMYCRVPTVVFSTGDEGVMRNWAHDNATGGDVPAPGISGMGSAGKLTLNWNVRVFSDEDDNPVFTKDFCSTGCASGTCGHGSNYRQAQSDVAPSQSRFSVNPFRNRERKAPPKPPEPIVAKPITRMK